MSQSSQPGGPAWRAANEPVPFEHNGVRYPGYVAGWCGHRVAESEWRAGFRVCERCPESDQPVDCCPDAAEEPAGPVPLVDAEPAEAAGETVEDAEVTS